MSKIEFFEPGLKLVYTLSELVPRVGYNKMSSYLNLFLDIFCLEIKLCYIEIRLTCAFKDEFFFYLQISGATHFPFSHPFIQTGSSQFFPDHPSCFI